ncbi:polyprenyl diphosphate synthase [Amaricoccus sp.]|uniref:polyprenyl diphosphate synthase n=1 Tax=Amaricoccus sp. TaxID=1872485 RepID=UPI001B70888B|nr:polyprenyl diphosphate synthase [Amaricoccus sp.]MBP7003167.1 di-trans,poly-cis-decaprenylcistransferase [Amaricoccus sp.]
MFDSGGAGSFHVGVIMDGNGRWAESRGMSRLAGHARGARRVTEIVRACPELGVSHLTLYAFSTENWRRPLAEVEGLMRIFRTYIARKTDLLAEQGVRVRFLGMRHRVPGSLQRLMAEMEARTAHCGGLQLSIAIDYGGRDELTRAVRDLAGQVAAGEIAPEEIGDAAMAAALDTRALPDPDLVIRTSGERRVSNFLLWQTVYAEFDFPETTWPDFTVASFAAAVERFRRRERRFGAVRMVPLAAGE